MDSSTPPPTISLPRFSTLAACVLVALGSGTNYAFSAYGPQLGERLGLTHTQLNVVGIAGNIGVFGSAPMWGRTVDAHGPKPLFAVACVLLLGGYSGIRYFYQVGKTLHHSPLPTLSYSLLAFCNFMTGVAGTAGIMGSVNTTAKTFPDEARASTTGLVLSGFGLSAFFFSTIADHAFPGNTSSLLSLLTLGTAIPMILGFFFVHPIPLPSNDHNPYERADPESSASDTAPNVIYHRCNQDDSRTPLLSGQHVPPCNRYRSIGSSASPPLDYPTATPESLMTPRTNHSEDLLSDSSVDVRRLIQDRGMSDQYRVSSQAEPRRTNGTVEPNVYGLALWKTADFWLMFSIFGLLTGTGLMYINNVGSISQVLIAQNDPDYDLTLAARIQAQQVTIVSLMNCAGRIFFGFISDFTKVSLRKPRSFCFILTSSLSLLVQILLKHLISDVHSLSWGSAMLGFVYGGSFSFLPTLCIGYFGFVHFSENFGFVTLSPVITGYIFSQVFGRTLDAHEAPSALGSGTLDHHQSRSLAPPQVHRCLEGSACYAGAFNVTIFACVVALSLSSWISWRDVKKIERERGAGGRSGYGIASKPGSSSHRTAESR